MCWTSNGPPVCPWRGAGRAVLWCMEAPVVTVGVDASSVESRLQLGAIRCPGCGDRLAGWGHARRRVVRGAGPGGGEPVGVRPRRARCCGCRRTHVLLPVFMLVRRADTVEVIGAALAARAAGAGARSIARTLGRPVETGRGGRRRFGGRLAAVRVVFTGLAVRVGVDPGVDQVPPAAETAWADAVAAIGAAAASVGSRFGGPVQVWRTACAVSAGGLLGPSSAVSWPGLSGWLSGWLSVSAGRFDAGAGCNTS